MIEIVENVNIFAAGRLFHTSQRPSIHGLRRMILVLQMELYYHSKLMEELLLKRITKIFTTIRSILNKINNAIFEKYLEVFGYEPHDY